MRFDTAGAPHVPSPRSVSWTMAQVLLALIPGVVAHWIWFGPGIMVQLVLAISAALLFEWAMLRLRGRPVDRFLGDLSAPVTAVLYVLCLPPLMPWWAAFIGMFFAIVVAKHLYGGLGYNVFNPAMVGFVVILVSFPLEASQWLAPVTLAEQQLSFGAVLTTIFSSSPPDGMTWDAITRATPLDVLREGALQDIMTSEIARDPIFGHYGGVGWEAVAICYGLGGLFLIYRRATYWHVPVGVLATILVVTLPFYMVDPFLHPFPFQHIMAGGTVLCAFFIATDPVSGCVSNRGRLIFGAGVALITLAIRRWGGYPDGIAFAILIMNMAAPMIDRYTRPRSYGR